MRCTIFYENRLDIIWEKLESSDLNVTKNAPIQKKKKKKKKKTRDIATLCFSLGAISLILEQPLLLRR